MHLDYTILTPLISAEDQADPYIKTCWPNCACHLSGWGLRSQL